jgi:hypothetical protein
MLIETDWGSYPYYHTTQDTFAHQDIDYGMEILKVAAAALATWSGVVE